MRRWITAFVTIAAVLLGPSAFAADAPPGFTVTEQADLGPGLTRTVLTSTDPPQVVNVARLRPDTELTLRTVVSNDAVGHGLERTSAMCRRVECVAAVNGDFFFPGGAPVGGVVSLGELIRSPASTHHQLVVSSDGALHTGGLDWSAALVSTDLRRLEIDAVNLPRQADGLVLYTPPYGSTTATNPHGIELTATVNAPTGRVRIDHTAVITLKAIRDGQGSTPIPSDGLVLSGHGAGADALRDLWSRVEAGSASEDVLLRIESNPHAAESIGGSPVLVRDGARWFTDDATSFVRGRHPRTLAGRTAAGEMLLVTVDGRQPGYSVGISLGEAADLMIGLGATEAINLDGGGSTTFVVNGEVANKPSDRAVRRGGDTSIVHAPDGRGVIGHVERPVTVALAVVSRSIAQVEPAGATTLKDLDLPQALQVAPPAGDPASDPTSALPVILPEEGQASRGPVPLAALTLLLSAGTLVIWRRPSRVVVRTPQGLRSLTTFLITASAPVPVDGAADAPRPMTEGRMPPSRRQR